MEDPNSSPERSVKVKYSGRRKRKTDTTANHAEDSDGSVEDGHANHEIPPEQREAVGKASDKGKGKDSIAQRHTQPLDLPGPDPNDSHSSSRTKAKHISHSRVSSLAHNTISDAPSVKPPSSTSPGSNKKPGSNHRGTPESIADDQSSVGDGPKHTRARKTEAERKEFFENDPHSGDVEPHRIFCTGCNNWVQLNSSRRYVMRPWLEHRKQCRRQSSARRSAEVASETVNCTSAAAEREGDAQPIEQPQPPAQAASPGDVADATGGPEPPPSVIPKAESPISTKALIELPFAQTTPSPAKRAREDSEEEEDSRRVRPRTEMYESPEGDAPGFLDWLLFPIRSFVRGFKEGMSST
ncbi:hypothetical protein CERSUDRAFT_112914 [Gelatoporia subvermispora B]|uniref:Uncharacterized protein n=1 Tax=Ceriporiopsis subvermispora (strain B) TaxID=914234 RepID=M2RLA6_CERS8|nr:hypothetical protein CERSUDRAFT_112914 [Gelatoporia subvermispora B]